MDLQLTGKVAVVTGGSKGIGRSIVDAFAAEGAAIALCARGAEALKQVQADLASRDVRTYAESVDVRDGAALTSFLDNARAELGRIDVLVNNTSAMADGNDDEAFRAMFEVDLLGAQRATNHVVPFMTENGGGAVIHIASVSGMGVDDPAYGSLKAALIALGRNQAEQLLGSGIRVNVVAPGSIEFPGGFWDDVRRDDPALYADVLAGCPAGRLGRPEEVAAAVVFLASPVASWVAGSLLRVDGAQFKGNR